MRALQSIDAVDKQTLRNFEKQCLHEEMIRRIRENQHINTAVFAAYLNASISTVQKWESGDKKHQRCSGTFAFCD